MGTGTSSPLGTLIYDVENRIASVSAAGVQYNMSYFLRLSMSVALSLSAAAIAISYWCPKMVSANVSRYCAAYFRDNPAEIDLFPMEGPEATIPLSVELPAGFRLIEFSSDGTAVYLQKSIPLGPSDGIVKIEFRPTRRSEVRGSTEFGLILFLTPSRQRGGILVSGGLKNPKGECGAYEIDSVSGTIHTLRAEVSRECGGALGPVSPDGKQVLNYGRQELSILDLKTGVRVRLGRGLTQGSWSPDGRWIAAWGGGKVVLVDPTNVSSRKHLGGSGFGSVSWSPDSKLLLVGTSQLSCAPTLYGASLEVIDVDSGHHSIVKSSRCKIATTSIGWIDREAVQ